MFDLSNRNLNYSLTAICKEKKNGAGIVYLQVLVMRKQILKATGINCLVSNVVNGAADFKYISKKDPQHAYKDPQIKIQFNQVKESILEAVKQYGHLNPDLAKLAIDNKYAKRDTLLDFVKKYVADKDLKPNTKKRYSSGHYYPH